MCTFDKFDKISFKIRLLHNYYNDLLLFYMCILYQPLGLSFSDNNQLCSLHHTCSFSFLKNSCPMDNETNNSSVEGCQSHGMSYLWAKFRTPISGKILIITKCRLKMVFTTHSLKCWVRVLLKLSGASGLQVNFIEISSKHFWKRLSGDWTESNALLCLVWIFDIEICGNKKNYVNEQFGQI